MYHPAGADGTPPAVLLNDNAFQYIHRSLGNDIDVNHRGVALRADDLLDLNSNLLRDAPTLPPDVFQDRRDIIKALEYGLRQNDGRGVGVVRIQEGINPEIIPQLKSHEFVHVMQENWRLPETPNRNLVRAALTPHLDSIFDDAFETAKEGLIKQGYKKIHEETHGYEFGSDDVWREIPAWIVGGHYERLGLSDEQAEALLTPYAWRLDKAYGGRAVQETLAHGSPLARKVAAEFPITPEHNFPPAPHRYRSDLYYPGAPSYQTPPTETQGQPDFTHPHPDIPPASVMPSPNSSSNRLQGLLPALPPAAAFLSSRPAAGPTFGTSGAALPGLHTLPPRLTLQDVLGNSVPQANTTQASTTQGSTAPQPRTGRLTLAQVQAHEATLPRIVQHLNRLPLPQALGVYAASSRLEQQVLGGALRQRLRAAAGEHSLTTKDWQQAHVLGLISQ